MSFVDLYMDEFFQNFIDMRRLNYLMKLRHLEYLLYVGIYGEEPPEVDQK